MPYNYRENVAGMAEAINRKYAKYARPSNNDRYQDKFLDLTETEQTHGPNANANSKTLKASVNNNQPILAFIPEDKGVRPTEDEYEKYNQVWDGQADEHIINSGATIIRSEITLTDSSGNNKRLVRRN